MTTAEIITKPLPDDMIKLFDLIAKGTFSPDNVETLANIVYITAKNEGAGLDPSFANSNHTNEKHPTLNIVDDISPTFGLENKESWEALMDIESPLIDEAVLMGYLGWVDSVEVDSNEIYEANEFEALEIHQENVVANKDHLLPLITKALERDSRMNPLILRTISNLPVEDLLYCIGKMNETDIVNLFTYTSNNRENLIVKLPGYIAEEYLVSGIDSGEHTLVEVFSLLNTDHLNNNRFESVHTLLMNSYTAFLAATEKTMGPDNVISNYDDRDAIYREIISKDDRKILDFEQRGLYARTTLKKNSSVGIAYTENEFAESIPSKLSELADEIEKYPTAIKQ